MAANVISETTIGYYARFSLVGFNTVLKDRRSGLTKTGYAVLKGDETPDIEQLK